MLLVSGSTIAALCYPANLSGSIVLTSDPVTLGSFQTNNVGAFFGAVTIPRNTTAGAHRITLTGGTATAFGRRHQ